MSANFSVIDSSLNSRQLARHFLVGLIGSAVLVAMLFYAVSTREGNVDPTRIVDVIGDSSWMLFFLFVLTSIVGIWFRSVRYRILIVAAGESAESTPGHGQMLLVTAIRGMVVDLLPARLGELLYIGLLKKVAGTSVSSGLSSLLFAMMLDIAVLAPVTVGLGLLVGFPNTTPYQIAIVALVVVAVFFAGARYILPWFAKVADTLKDSGSRIISGLANLVLDINRAFQLTLEAGVFVKVVLLTIVVRALKYLGLMLLFTSIVGGSFQNMEVVSNVQALTAMIASEMTASLPIPTLMSFGAWELGGTTFLALFGAPPTDSLLALIAIHILTQSLDYGIGIAALLLIFLPVREINRPKAVQGFPFAYAGIFALAILAALYSWNIYRGAERAPENLASAELYAQERPDWFGSTTGFVVWSSNRQGNHNILLMTLPDQQVRALTTHPHTETHPRISPDGKQVAFIRSHRPWQSWRAQRPWDVWIVDIASGKERKIVNGGTAPTWSEDGKTIYFQRTLGEIWKVDLDSGEETRLLVKNTNGLPDEEFLWPSVSRDGQIALSYKDRGRPTNLLVDTQGRGKDISLGCMITWSPKNDFIMFVSNDEGGNGLNQFNRYDPATGEITLWLDLPGSHSHEYFPRLDASQQYLVFGASSGGHEPDIADYEIFLWKTDTPQDQAQRLTFDPGNDSWPDIYIAPADG